MIDYETFCRLQHLREHDRLTVAQIARTLALDPRTVTYWLAQPRYRPRQSTPRPSKLDPFKPTIRRLLEHHPYSAQQIFQHLTADGFDGGITLVKDYVRTVRPPRKPAFLTLEFARGECAQVDWGHWHAVSVGRARRRLAFFVMVLAYSRLMYLEFTVSQTMEFFLNAHLNAFESFGRLVPAKIMVDNLKSAVLQRLTGQAPVFNPRYKDFADHFGFEIVPCGVGQGQEKGRVESAVGYVLPRHDSVGFEDMTSPFATVFSSVAVVSWRMSARIRRCNSVSRLVRERGLVWSSWCWFKAAKVAGKFSNEPQSTRT